ncbi:MAG: hypothetical protein AAGA18_13965 [Verrucomicrobiota bacterium]
MSSLFLGATVSGDASGTVSPYEKELELKVTSELNSEQVAILQNKTRISCSSIAVKLYEAWLDEQYDTFSPDDGVRIFSENYRGAYSSPTDFIHDERYSEQSFLGVKAQCEQEATRAELDGLYQFIDAPDQYGELIYVFDGPAVYARR